jgi:flagellar assembly factor FliW
MTRSLAPLPATRSTTLPGAVAGRYDAPAQEGLVPEAVDRTSEAASGPSAATPAGAKVLTFPDGILGFPGSTRFALVNDSEDALFQLLQCLDDDSVALIVAVPWLFFPDYSPEISELERKQLKLHSPDDAIVFCPVTLTGDPDVVYLNLLGPFVVHRESLEGRQVVLADSEWPVRAPISLA